MLRSSKNWIESTKPVLMAGLPLGWSGPSLQGGGDLFTGSPFLMLGIAAGLVAVGFAVYSALQMRGGRMASVFLIFAVGLLLLDIGVVAVTFFEVGPVHKLVHDFGLLLGFVLSLVAFARMRSMVG